MAAGIGMVHQHFMLVEVFTVAENMILGREPSMFIDLRRRPGEGPGAVRSATTCPSTPTP